MHVWSRQSLLGAAAGQFRLTALVDMAFCDMLAWAESNFFFVIRSFK